MEVLREEVCTPRAVKPAETEMSMVGSKRNPAPSSTGKEMMVATRAGDIHHRITSSRKRICDIYLSSSVYCSAQQARQSHTSSNQMAKLGL